MEFLRFGSSIPGGYWGCCAVCIIQNFKFEPSAKASIELVSGDGGYPIMKGKSAAFVGPTYEDIFKARLRIGTFSGKDMPNHTFLAVLTEGQISAGVGKKWLEILRREGFEFLRVVDNSVYTGPKLFSGESSGCSCDDDDVSPHKNYVFGLFRNIGQGRVDDTTVAPEAWTSLPDPYSGDMSPDNVLAVQKKLWNDLGPAKTYTADEIASMGAPVTHAGRRLPGAAPETREQRKKREEADKKKSPTTPYVDPFSMKAA